VPRIVRGVASRLATSQGHPWRVRDAQGILLSNVAGSDPDAGDSTVYVSLPWSRAVEAMRGRTPGKRR
jgi:hypothetical protein